MMSSAPPRPLAERLNINTDSRSVGGGSQRADRVGFLFDKPNLLRGKARKEGLNFQHRGSSFFFFIIRVISLTSNTAERLLKLHSHISQEQTLYG